MHFVSLELLPELESPTPNPESAFLCTYLQRAASTALEGALKAWVDRNRQCTWFSLVQILLDLACDNVFDRVLMIHRFLCPRELPRQPGERLQLSRSLREQLKLTRTCFDVYVHRARKSWRASFIAAVRQDAHLAQLLRAASCTKPGVLAALRARRGTPRSL